MNIVIYNFFNEIDSSLTVLTDNHTNSIYLPVSLSDLKRINQISRIDILIMKINQEIESLIEFIHSINPKTEMHIFTQCRYEQAIDYVFLYPLNYSLNELISLLINK